VRLTLRRLLLAGLLLLIGIGASVVWQSRAPDLRRLYASGMERVQVPPVIIVPGILGSRPRGDLPAGAIASVMVRRLR
jgi:hypothetical protein